jgi:hypothetical protein
MARMAGFFLLAVAAAAHGGLTILSQEYRVSASFSSVEYAGFGAGVGDWVTPATEPPDLYVSDGENWIHFTSTDFYLRCDAHLVQPTDNWSVSLWGEVVFQPTEPTPVTVYYHYPHDCLYLWLLDDDGLIGGYGGGPQGDPSWITLDPDKTYRLQMSGYVENHSWRIGGVDWVMPPGDYSCALGASFAPIPAPGAVSLVLFGLCLCRLFPRGK